MGAIQCVVMTEFTRFVVSVGFIGRPPDRFPENGTCMIGSRISRFPVLKWCSAIA
ncbi:hypothetical protein BC826DRAFT_1041945 [Russula brevipes]|nr:hypothetical protein BC826DRAFT_1041945 [Russula brevipes]